MNQNLTLSELNNQVKEALSGAFPTSIWVVAEVSELKVNRNGHCYLELIEKEGSTIKARSRATIWSYSYRILKPYFETSTGQSLTAGIKILVQVTVEFHAAYGLSLNIKDIDPTYTVGDMELQRKEIMDRLKKEGVVDMNKELELPLVPQKIAVISSATAAGYQDFMDQLINNDTGFKFYTRLYEATMQGEEAVPSIIDAFERIYPHEDFFDVVVIIRGGGATADLSSFDDYDLAYHITQFPLPVITGIGHEKDDTVIDLVAHTRMKTPTAVAGFLLDGVYRFFDLLTDREDRIVQKTRDILAGESNKLERLSENFNFSVSGYINDKRRELARTGNEIQQKVSRFSYERHHELNKLIHDTGSKTSIWYVAAKNKLESKREKLSTYVMDILNSEKERTERVIKNLNKESIRKLERESNRLQNFENTMRLLNPDNILKRGYSLTLKDGKVVKSAKQLNINDEIESRFSEGAVTSKIVKTD